MEKIIINGGKRLSGGVNIQSAKNSVLTLIAASLLTQKQVVIKKCPKITDVVNMLNILKELGGNYIWQDDSVIIDAGMADKYEIPHKLAKEIRSSIFLLGSILSRFKRAKVAYPGGCDIGIRPIDLHLKGLKDLNVSITESGGYIICDGSDMRGGTVQFDYPSVGATENVMMAAVLTKGSTVIYNAAKEPEIVDLQDFINAMGGKISGAGSGTICIEGVARLGGAEFSPIPDRIAAGTYLIACLMTGGSCELSNCRPKHIYSLISKLSDNACKIECFSDKIIVSGDKRLNSVQLFETSPYPGFPTDLQAQTVALQAISEGTSVVIENMFETRFKHINELNKMGADITVRERMAIVRGVPELFGAEIAAYDLRGGAALVLAGLAAQGKTTLNNIYHVDRGYFELERTLSGLGADIKRIS